MAVDDVTLDETVPPGSTPAWAARSVFRQLLSRLDAGAELRVLTTRTGLRAELRAHGHDVIVRAPGDAAGEPIVALPLAADEQCLAVTVAEEDPEGWTAITRDGHRIVLPQAAVDPGIRLLRTGQRLLVLCRGDLVVDAWL